MTSFIYMRMTTFMLRKRKVDLGSPTTDHRNTGKATTAGRGERDVRGFADNRGDVEVDGGKSNSFSV